MRLNFFGKIPNLQKSADRTVGKATTYSPSRFTTDFFVIFTIPISLRYTYIYLYLWVLFTEPSES